MKKSHLLAVLLLVVTWACSAPVQEPPQEPVPTVPAVEETEPRFIHTVLFWLKEGTTEEQKQKLVADCYELLGGITSVKYVQAGPPAGIQRDVVDNSFGVGLVVHFDDAAGHDLYQDDPLHVQFIEENEEIWERVQVYDILLDE